MFDALFGNPNIEKVLIFLLVNEKCYASQLAQCLGCALTPIQQALNRLEKGQIIISSLAGKTRLFRFNPHYPFLKELLSLLNQGYHHLQLHERHKYYSPERMYAPKIVKADQTKPKNDRFADVLAQLWDGLIMVKTLSFSAQSKQPGSTGWNGTGQAEVKVETVDRFHLIFYEKGMWTTEEGKQFDFKNAYRWTLDDKKRLITLEHLRHGVDKPVFLFELTPVTANRFETVHPFLCRNDSYFATLLIKPPHIAFNWRIIGPNKNEEIHYLYY